MDLLSGYFDQKQPHYLKSISIFILIFDNESFLGDYHWPFILSRGKICIRMSYLTKLDELS